MKFKYRRFALTADPHIENNKNLPFVLKTFDWIVEVLRKEQIQCLFILGDFINARDSINTMALNKAADILNTLEQAGIEVYLLLGNHERYTKATDFTITSIKPFERHSHIITKFEILEGDDFNLTCIPNIETNEEFSQVIEAIKVIPEKYNILMAHHGIQGAVSNDLYNIYDKTGVNSDIFTKFDQVFMGHYHRKQEMPPNILYVGSPVQLSHGEELSEKGLTIWNADGRTKTFILNPQYEVYATILDTNADVSNKFVRYVATEFIDNAEAKRIKEELQKRGALEVKIEVKSKDFEEVLKSDNAELDMSQIVCSYIDKNADKLNKERCLKTYTTIKESVNEN